MALLMLTDALHVEGLQHDMLQGQTHSLQIAMCEGAQPPLSHPLQAAVELLCQGISPATRGSRLLMSLFAAERACHRAWGLRAARSCAPTAAATKHCSALRSAPALRARPASPRRLRPLSCRALSAPPGPMAATNSANSSWWCRHSPAGRPMLAQCTSGS